MTKTKVLKCPHCGSEGEDGLCLSSIEMIPANARLMIVDEDDLDYAGQTDVDWDYQKATGLLVCQNCSHIGWPEDFGFDRDCTCQLFDEPGFVVQCNAQKCENCFKYSEVRGYGLCMVTTMPPARNPIEVSNQLNAGYIVPPQCRSYKERETS